MKRISFKTSKLAHKKGYNVPCTHYYKDNGTYVKMEYGLKVADCNLAPFQGELQEWLRKKNIFVVVHPEAYPNSVNWCVQVLIYNNASYDCWDNKSSALYGDNGEFKTYENALEFGLKMALKRM